MWILPSLGRPERAQRVAEKIPEDPITLRLHWGDEKLDEYQRILWPKAWKVKIAKKLSLAETLNWALEDSPDEDFYGFLADDTLPEPKDWRSSLEYLAGYWNIAYPDDTIHGKSLCTHFCIGGRLVREVGFLALPGLKHNFLDNVWMTIGQNTGLLRYNPNVKFNHEHELKKKELSDQTYRIGQSYYANDRNVFKYWLDSGSAQSLIDRIRTTMGFV